MFSSLSSSSSSIDTIMIPRTPKRKNSLAEAVFYPSKVASPRDYQSRHASHASLYDAPLASTAGLYENATEFPFPTQKSPVTPAGRLTEWLDGLKILTPSPYTSLSPLEPDTTLVTPEAALAELDPERYHQLFCHDSPVLPATELKDRSKSVPIDLLDDEDGPNEFKLLLDAYDISAVAQAKTKYVEPTNALGLANVPRVEPRPEPTCVHLEGHILRDDFRQRYTLTAELGQGGFGFVCSARDHIQGGEVAVKFIFKDRLEIKDGKGRFGGEPCESYVLKRLDHPGIVKFIELYEDDKFYYLVQTLHGDPWQKGKTIQPVEKPAHNTPQSPGFKISLPQLEPHSYSYNVGQLLPGASERPQFARRASYDLFEAAECYKFSESEGKAVFKQIVDAVAYMHHYGVYHRDLKDENVVIDRWGTIKIIDFGSATIEDPRNPVLHTSFHGTMSYASPEILNGEQYYSAPVDVWALGIILCVILCGESPFPSSDYSRAGCVRLKRPMSRAAHRVMMKCFVVDPRKRPTIMDIQADDWFTSLTHRGSV